jgi:aspartate aminotransferase-like enzyme
MSTKQSAIEALTAALEAIETAGPYPNSAARADAALAAFRQWMDAEGLVCVPREATQEMTGAVCEPGEDRRIAMKLYALMIAAAPDPLGDGP